jgi:hypothetical protein
LRSYTPYSPAAEARQAVRFEVDTEAEDIDQYRWSVGRGRLIG